MKHTSIALLTTLLFQILFPSCIKTDLFVNYSKNLACEINGRAWTPRNEPFTFGTDPVFEVNAGKYNSFYYLQVIGTRYYKRNDTLRTTGIHIFFDSIPLNLSLPYSKEMKSYRTMIGYHNTETGDYWLGGNDYDEGLITIFKYDTTNHIYSGTFHCKLVNGYGKLVTITNGRFNSKP